MKKWLALFTVFTSATLTVLAQNPTPNAPSPMGVPVVGATPAPAATAPPVVGVNADAPAPPASLPPGYPTTTPPAGVLVMPSGSANLPVTPTTVTPANARSRSQTTPLTPEQMQQRMQDAAAEQKPDPFTALKAEEPENSHALKSEIVPVLPPAQKPPELRAVLRTSVGDITIRLDRLNAPHTVDYFTGLARGEIDFRDVKTSKPVKRPFYNGLIFHYVLKNTLIQTGDPFGTGRGDSGTTINDEIKPTMKFDRPGLVAMAPARGDGGTSIVKNSNSSQFFITAREMPDWNGQFTIFGQVEDGLDVVQKIANSKVGPTGRPIKRIYLVAVEIIESAK